MRPIRDMPGAKQATDKREKSQNTSKGVKCIMFKTDSVRFSIDALVKADILKVSADTTSEMFDRIKNIELSTDEVQKLQPMTDYVGVTEEDRQICCFRQIPQTRQR